MHSGKSCGIFTRAISMVDVSLCLHPLFRDLVPSRYAQENHEHSPSNIIAGSMSTQYIYLDEGTKFRRSISMLHVGSRIDGG